MTKQKSRRHLNKKPAKQEELLRGDSVVIMMQFAQIFHRFVFELVWLVQSTKKCEGFHPPYMI